MIADEPHERTTSAESPERPSDLHEITRPLGTIHARFATAAQVRTSSTLLSACSAPMPPSLSWTYYSGGKTHTRDGDACSGTLEELEQGLSAYAQKVVQKGKGGYFIGARSKNGGCCDADIDCIAVITLDCDDKGDWHVLRAVLDQAGVGYVVQRSSSHNPPDAIKWHLTFALAREWRGDKPTWRATWRFLVGMFAAVGKLTVDFDHVDDKGVRRPNYGFDHTTDRLGQPIFIAAKRSKDQAPPETIYVPGKALDLDKLLADGGFDPAWFEVAKRKEARSQAVREASAARVASGIAVDPTSGLLALAFSEAGMLGQRIERSSVTGFAVACPREVHHTSGDRFDTSTMIVDPTESGGKGHFICLHSCGSMEAEKALKLLPPEAVERAKKKWKEANRKRKKATANGDGCYFQGDDPWKPANAIGVRKVVAWLGLLDNGNPCCPGCGESASVSVLDSGLRCDICPNRGRNGVQSNLDLVVAARGVSLKKAHALLAKQFGLEPLKLMSEDGRRRIESGQDVHRILDELDEALGTADPRLYQRGPDLVIVRGVTAEDARRLNVNFSPDSMIIAALSSATLLSRITEFVDYGHYEKSEEGVAWVSDWPNSQVLAALLGKPFWAHIRSIRGIAVTPIMHLDDGSIAADGYDPKTQYLVATNIALPEIASNPTKSDAEAALKGLHEPFEQFPYETEAERYTPVALSLTLLLQAVIGGNRPGYLNGAPQKNCGKSLAAKGAIVLATGRMPASNTWPKAEEEQEKMIGAAAEAGADVLFFDNVAEGAIIGGPPLDKVLTCDGVNGFRILGRSELKRLPWGATVCFTANRPRVGGDSDRRIVQSIMIRRDEPIEYRHAELLSYIQADRTRLLVAALTLVRAWVVAGKPRENIRRLDSFEEWGWTVPAIIKWAGGPDVRELVRDLAGTDRDELEGRLLEDLYEYLRSTGKQDVTVKTLVCEVFATVFTTDNEFAELRESMEGVGGIQTKSGQRSFDARRFGAQLAKMKDVLQGKYRLRLAGHTSGKARWTVERVEGGQGGQEGQSEAPRTGEEKNKAHTTNNKDCDFAPTVAAGNDPPDRPNPPPDAQAESDAGAIMTVPEAERRAWAKENFTNHTRRMRALAVVREREARISNDAQGLWQVEAEGHDPESKGRSWGWDDKRLQAALEKLATKRPAPTAEARMQDESEALLARLADDELTATAHEYLANHPEALRAVLNRLRVRVHDRIDPLS